MAPTDSALNVLASRATCYRAGYGYYRCDNRWHSFGRWIVLAGVIVVVLLILMSCALTARRRRRRGNQPMYGTGWMAPGGKQYDQQQMNGYQQGNYNPTYGQGYNAQQQGGYNAPPAYGQQPQNTGTTFNPNDGYYGQQQSGVQPPQNTYQREPNYAPPAGPPPGK
ncbi:hypothetical protein C2857_005125 [Epichloe festucae Fl1]|uniref:Chitin synthesis regulation, Congo red resistance, RCR protein n=1 Tax=Epichloe festucae (strain Fl1) TaxID=877507 RepID=A0A7S9PVN2_EPIFF|nr:hypothetical protein C2857_005125 [Epichloe festucae Fl1]